MTAILGLNYLDGVLMMADTEETTSTATKSECDQLYRFTFPIGTVITGGAGDGQRRLWRFRLFDLAKAMETPMPQRESTDGTGVKKPR
jgi:20S proteasome alpha/beta subunit